MTISITPEILRAVAASSNNALIKVGLEQQAARMEDPYHELIAGAEKVYEAKSVTHIDGRMAAYRHLIDTLRPPVVPGPWETMAEVPEGIVVRDSDEHDHWYFTRDGGRMMRVYSSGEFGHASDIDDYDHHGPFTFHRDV